jgi:hypothetical protein
VRSFAARLADRRYGPAPRTAAASPAELPSRRLDVIGAGFGRTGTMSLKLALEQLGLGPCYHMTEIVRNPSHARMWNMAESGQPVDWRVLFARYRAAVDWPACHYYRELMEAFPAAKVILTTRDAGQWYESMTNTLYRLKTATDERLRARQAMIGGSGEPPAENRIWAQVFSGAFTDRRHAIEVFRRHNAEVISHVPAGRLLVYQVSEGWPPLCDFLGVPVPDGPFPVINTTPSFREFNRVQLGLPDASR